jgi:branched-chain amino acid transport system permease protein
VSLVDIFLQQMINGLTLGSIYALVALGYTMVYGVLGLINFAHGEVVMVGALVALSVMNELAGGVAAAPMVLFLGVLAAVLVCMLLGGVLERVAYRPLRHAPRLAPLITAIGMSIVVQQLAMLIWGRGYHAVPPLISSEPYTVLGASVTPVQLFIMVLAALLMAGLTWLIQRSRLGRAMRATAENPSIARLMGVDTDRVIALTFFLGSALAAVAGVMVGLNYGIVHYHMGFMLGLKAFTAAVLGGIGHVPGAMLGGLLLGVIEALGAGYLGDLTGGVLGSHYQDVVAFFVLILVLIFRPSGLIGEKISERA